MSDSDLPWFANQVALVTGSPARVGRAIAIHLAKLGMNVAVHCHRSLEDAETTAELVREHQVASAVFPSDLGQGATGCHELIEAIEQRLGAPSVLVNNASIFERSSLEDLAEADWERTMRVNLQAPVFLAQAVVRKLNQRRGHLIQLLDWRAENPIPGHLSYTISKAGLSASTKLLAQELAPHIQVNGIAPGAILPPPGHGPEYLQPITDRIPLKRSGSPAEIVHAVDYLLRSDFVTGEVLHVTGGQQLGAYG